MATEAISLKLAKRIAEQCRGVRRNEWMRWVQLAERYGVYPAIDFAARMGQDQTLRPQIKQAYGTIARSLKTSRSDLRKLSREEQLETFGYVGWYLKVEEERKERR